MTQFLLDLCYEIWEQLRYKLYRTPIIELVGGGESLTVIYVTVATLFFSEHENYTCKKWQVIFLQESLPCYYSDHGVVFEICSDTNINNSSTGGERNVVINI
jgi:hypothetical protein